jgi:histidinol-phosphate aminotransferase
VCGSFSKIYGLAGLRVGYLVANQAHTGLLKKLVSPFGVDSFSLEVAKHMIAQDAWLRNRTAEIKGGIRVLQEADTLPFRLTHTSAPVALIEYMGAESLYRTLQGQGVATVAGEEFPGLGDINAVRVIIRSMEDMLELKRILANIS